MRRTRSACARALPFSLHAVEQLLHVQLDDDSVHDHRELLHPALFPREQVFVGDKRGGLFGQRHYLDGLEVLYAAVYAVEVRAGDGEQAAAARDRAFDIDEDAPLLRVRADEREVIFELEDDARAPARRLVTQYVRAYDEARQQAFGQHGVVILKVQTLRRVELARLVGLLLVE